jgi:hypothetical protein
VGEDGQGGLPFSIVQPLLKVVEQHMQPRFSVLEDGNQAW